MAITTHLILLALLVFVGISTHPITTAIIGYVPVNFNAHSSSKFKQSNFGENLYRIVQLLPFNMDSVIRQ